MKRLITISILLFSYILTPAQIGTVSPDGKLLATFVYDQGQYQFLIHQLSSGKMVQKIPVAFNKLNRAEFSSDNKFIVALSGNILYIYDRQKKQLVKKFYQVRDFSLSRSILAVLSNSYPYTLDLSTLKQKKYSIAAGKIPEKILLSPGGKFLAVITADNHVYVFTYGNPSMIGIENGNMAFFTSSQILISHKSKSDIKIHLYSLPYTTGQMQARSTFDAVEVLKTSGENPFMLNPQQSLINPDNGIIALFLNYGAKKKILFYDIKNKKETGTITNAKFPAANFAPVKWTTKHTLILQGSGLNGLEYDLGTGIITPLRWEMLNPDHSPDLAPTEQSKKRIFSPDYHFVAMNVYEGPRLFLLVRDAMINKRQISYADARLITFSRDSRSLFLLIKGVVFQLSTADIRQAMINNTVAQIQQLGTAVYGQITETLKKKDDTPPPGYHYIFTKAIKDVRQTDSAKLMVLFRGMGIDPKKVELKLNLVDSRGNIITGATNPQWLYLWCNLLLQHKDLQVDQTNFIVKEVHDNDPTAYALVLDHSGSMGDRRANALQFGALQLIKRKKPQDAFMLIKYDNRVKLIVGLTKNLSAFYKPLGNTGLQGFGGGTALNDAAYLAILKLAKSPYPRKVIYLFTDGYENSSLHTKEQVIKAAQKNKIEIFTIGFGKDINENYLQDMAYLTGGAFYHIYRTDELKRIFTDVDLKRRYFYKIDFSTRYPGKYLALIQLCQNFHSHDSLLISFNNNPKLPPEKRQIRLNPHITPGQKKAFEKKAIPCRPPDKPVKDKKIVQEFQNIDFPDILFEFDSDKIIKSEEKGLIEIAEFMKRHPDVYLLIEGHTDNIGSHQYNMDLSKRRAEAAKRLLVAHGIAPGRIFTRGYGETRPIASNDTEAGRARNRRIEFHIFKY